MEAVRYGMDVENTLTKMLLPVKSINRQVKWEITMRRCSGNNTEEWGFDSIFEKACPGCGMMMEFFKDERTGHVRCAEDLFWMTEKTRDVDSGVRPVHNPWEIIVLNLAVQKKDDVRDQQYVKEAAHVNQYCLFRF